MAIFNYLGSGMICVIIYYLISSLMLSKRENYPSTIGRTVVLAILFIILLRT